MASNHYNGLTLGGTVYSSAYLGNPNVASSYPGHGVPVLINQRAPASYDDGYGAAQYSRPQVAYPTNTTAMYPYSANTPSYTNTYQSVVSNYAATALYGQQASMNQMDYSANVNPGKHSNWNFRKNIKTNKMKAPPKLQQLHYCEVCKISCAGPQTYKEHLEGQRHKKKEAQLKTGVPNNSAKRGSTVGLSLRCELCDVTCTGNDAYAAHIRGSKHQKVLKLHTKLGKPIPSADSALVNSAANSKATQPAQGSMNKMKVVSTPKMSFVGGGKLQTTVSGGGSVQDVSTEDASGGDGGFQTASVSDVSPVETEGPYSQPVGHDYIDEVKGDDGKTISFHCKLCDCKFNDPNAKEMHLKGRRHRLQYKKKVDPNLVVDLKNNLKHKKVQDNKERRFYQRHQREQNYWSDWYQPPMLRYGYEGSVRSGAAQHGVGMSNQGGGYLSGSVPPPGAYPGYFRRHGNGSWDDNHIMQKHSDIYPAESDLDEIYRVVSVVEGALKLVSDLVSEESGRPMEEGDDTTVSHEMKQEANDMSNGDENQADERSDTDQFHERGDGHSSRVLKGLVRVGALAKNLLLLGDRDVDLVMMCAQKPTVSLLQKVSEHLPKQLQAVSPADTFEVSLKLSECGLVVSTTKDHKIVVSVAFTSPSMRELNDDVAEEPPMEMVKEDKEEYLDREKCLNALASFRHAKWYQARVMNLHPCPIIIRLLRDLCRRLPTWSPLNQWAVELLCERVISSAAEHLSPGEAFRHVLEAIASGLLLPGGAGLADPCEKEPVDALAPLTRQEREDITSSAQHALRLIAFRQIHKILGVEPIKTRNSKRRHESEADGSTGVEGTDDANKKVKKDTPEEENEPASKIQDDESADHIDHTQNTPITCTF